MIRILRYKNLKYTKILLHSKSMFFLNDVNNTIILITTLRYNTSSQIDATIPLSIIKKIGKNFHGIL